MKRSIRNYLLRNILKAIVAEDVVTVDKVGGIYLNGVKLTETEAKTLKREAKEFKQTRLYSILTNTLKHQAEKAMFTNSKSFDDMVSGKMMLYNVDVQENIVYRLSK